MAKSKIEWCDRVWNPVTGCTKVSPGCLNCYAERMSKRFAEPWGLPKDDPFKVTMHHDRLKQPLHWKKDSIVFVCSMADLFHDDVEESFIDEVFGVILAVKMFNNNPDHKFLILTKRAERMHEYFTERTPVELLKAWAFATDWVRVDDGNMFFHEYVESAVCHDWDEKGTNSNGSEYKEWGYPKQLFPLSNVWLGVTAENQEHADKRIPLLLYTPAVKRFVSVEPMVGPVDLSRNLKWPICKYWNKDGNPNQYGKYWWEKQKLASADWGGLDWVICGGESGPEARPVHPDWIRSLRDQCVRAEVPFLFKQWGEWEEGIGKTVEDRIIALDGELLGGGHPDYGGFAPSDEIIDQRNAVWMARVGKKAAGRLLDGELWDQYPNRR